MKSVKHQQIDMNGRQLHVFDGAVDFSEREHIYSVVKNSVYKIGNEDADAIETAQHKYMCSYYNGEDVDTVGLLRFIQDTPVQSLIDGLPLIRAHVNLSTPTDCHWAHDHRGQLGLLYYVNKHWKHDWAGETMFFNDDLSEVCFASVYKSGRIILFDGEIPHSVRPQSSVAPTYRFTLSLFFQKQ
jgi:hypothetical protein